MPPIHLIVGPPAVGKSTTSRALAQRFELSIHIPVDDLRDMVVRGKLLPGPVWSDALAQQVTLARTAAIQMALAYHAAGFAVVMDDFWDYDHREDYAALVGHPDFQRVVLLPKRAVAHQRNLARSGDTPDRYYIDEGIAIVYDRLEKALPTLAAEGWRVVNTSVLTPDEVVASILNDTEITPK